jgi:hypothetical protein
VLGVIGPPALAGRRSAPAALTPLIFAYAATFLSALGIRLPGIWNGVLSPLLALIVSAAYGLAIAGWLAVKGDADPRARALRRLERGAAGRGGAGLVGLGRRDAVDARRHRQRSLRLRPDGR